VHRSGTGPGASDNPCGVGGTAVSGSETPIHYNGTAMGSSGTRESCFDTKTVRTMRRAIRAAGPSVTPRATRMLRGLGGVTSLRRSHYEGLAPVRAAMPYQASRETHFNSSEPWIAPLPDESDTASPG